MLRRSSQVEELCSPHLDVLAFFFLSCGKSRTQGNRDKVILQSIPSLLPITFVSVSRSCSRCSASLSSILSPSPTLNSEWWLRNATLQPRHVRPPSKIRDPSITPTPAPLPKSFALAPTSTIAHDCKRPCRQKRADATLMHGTVTLAVQARWSLGRFKGCMNFGQG
jgi:hypothetical protein